MLYDAESFLFSCRITPFLVIETGALTVSKSKVKERIVGADH